MARSVSSAPIRERLNWEPDPRTYQLIRRLWIDHSKAEDARDLQGLIDTLSEDCVYEIVPTGRRWQGHAGARAFYTSFLGAFPDVRFALQDIVIGPQGVIEVTRMTGTHRGTWAGLAPTGRQIDTPIVIHFPWDPLAGKFAGERIYYDSAAFDGLS
jgi:predicted ester cyclase